jgi:hypothetical protein
MGSVLVVLNVSRPLDIRVGAYEANQMSKKDSQEIQDILLNRSAEFDRAAMTSNLSYPFHSGNFCKFIDFVDE